MANDDAHAFIKKLMSDESLLQKLDDRMKLEDFKETEVDPEELRDHVADVVPAFASEHGYDFTHEEGLAAFGEIQEVMASEEELSDEELEQVAGGKSDGEKAVQGIAIAATAATLGTACAITSATAIAAGNFAPDNCVKPFTGHLDD